MSEMPAQAPIINFNRLDRPTIQPEIGSRVLGMVQGAKERLEPIITRPTRALITGLTAAGLLFSGCASEEGGTKSELAWPTTTQQLPEAVGCTLYSTPLTESTSPDRNSLYNRPLTDRLNCVPGFTNQELQDALSKLKSSSADSHLPYLTTSEAAVLYAPDLEKPATQLSGADRLNLLSLQLAAISNSDDIELCFQAKKYEKGESYVPVLPSDQQRCDAAIELGKERLSIISNPDVNGFGSNFGSIGEQPIIQIYQATREGKMSGTEVTKLLGLRDKSIVSGMIIEAQNLRTEKYYYMVFGDVLRPDGTTASVQLYREDPTDHETVARGAIYHYSTRK